jgi:hypothetical protein
VEHKTPKRSQLVMLDKTLLNTPCCGKQNIDYRSILTLPMTCIVMNIAVPDMLLTWHKGLFPFVIYFCKRS